MTTILSPKGFLKVGGVVLVLVAVLGYVGIIGPTPEQSIFGDAWYFDNAENIAHLVLGVVALILAFAANAGVQKAITVVVGIIAVLAGLYSLMGTATLWGAGLENPLDTILHLVVGAWALAAGIKRHGGEMGAM